MIGTLLLFAALLVAAGFEGFTALCLAILLVVGFGVLALVLGKLAREGGS